MMISPGYSYSKAPDQQHFLGGRRTNELFSKMLANPKKRLAVQSVAALLGLPDGKRDYRVHAVGQTATYNMFGWQRPCYLLQEGYAKSFRELMDTTAWENYGTRAE